MEKLFDRVELYSLSARLLTGTTAVVAAAAYGVPGLVSMTDGRITTQAWVVLLLGYFGGIVLEEVSYFISELLQLKKKSVKRICSESAYTGYFAVGCEEKWEAQVERWKRKLVTDGHNDLLERYLINRVMSGSLAIVCVVLMIWISWQQAFNAAYKIGMSGSVGQHLMLLGVLLAVFLYRAYHYRDMRIREILNYYLELYQPGKEKA